MNTLDPCVVNLQIFFSKTRTEYRDRVFSENAIETPNQKPVDDEVDENGGLVDVWITQEQLTNAQQKLQELALRLHDNQGATDLEEIASQVEEIYQLVTCRAANLRYFDYWRATHNSHPSISLGCAWMCILTASLLQAIHGEDLKWRMIAGIVAALLIAIPILKNLPDPKQQHSDSIRKKLQQVFTSSS